MSDSSENVGDAGSDLSAPSAVEPRNELFERMIFPISRPLDSGDPILYFVLLSHVQT